MSNTDRIELERAWDQLQKATARISDLESQLASLTEENERLRRSQPLVGSQAELGTIREELASERARAEEAYQKGYTQGFADADKQWAADVSEAEQRAAALDQKLRAVRTAFLDGRLMDLGEILDNPNPESETDG